MDYEKIRQLVSRYLNDELSDEERQQLLQITEDADNADLIKVLGDMLAAEPMAHVPVDERRLRQSLTKVLAVDKGIRHLRVRRTVYWLRYAAAVILVAGIGAYAWLKERDQPHLSAKNNMLTAPVSDVAPGGQKAVLTLADGTAIQLDSAADGQLATQQGSQVLKKDGRVIYTSTDKEENIQVYNTLRTPRGGVYQITLPDGTRVWLNAASSISYPVAFTGGERVVKITGEVYFEVASHPQRPFIVKVNETNSIEVLGTQFDVKAYGEDDLISTTLLQGAVRIVSNGKKAALKPGQQASISDRQLLVKTIGQGGISEAMAWKEGRFNFQDASLQEIMRQLSRWYDIEVVYEKGIPDLEFIGEVERSLPLSQVLKGLKMSGVNFRLEKGRRLIVSP